MIKDKNIMILGIFMYNVIFAILILKRYEYDLFFNLLVTLNAVINFTLAALLLNLNPDFEDLIEKVLRRKNGKL